MATASPAQGLPSSLPSVRKITGWYIAAAVLFIVLGMLAIIEPALAGLAVSRLVGWLLVFGGVSHWIGAFKGGGAKQVIFQVLIGFAYLIGGFYCLMHPLLAIGTLTLLLAGVILAGGLLEIISYFRLKGEDASGWMLFNGIITLFLGGMIWFHWPSSSVWAIGIIVGVTLFMTGMARLMFGLAARKVMRQAPGIV
ncbi:MAG TPA: DUF308 domain-containing protein [Candidatus Acidoferrum sp.]|jgi:uncharacterized membrane protein HdeD (DUF308 family)|nr:DUF308 domain-containing protein [Candidatus Acidoferrum sp.]